MPLKPERSKAAVSSNISELVHSGRPKNQAIAIAMKKAGMSGALAGPRKTTKATRRARRRPKKGQRASP